jgi:hypothetical protein
MGDGVGRRGAVWRRVCVYGGGGEVSTRAEEDPSPERRRSPIPASDNSEKPSRIRPQITSPRQYITAAPEQCAKIRDGVIKGIAGRGGGGDLVASQ